MYDGKKSLLPRQGRDSLARGRGLALIEDIMWKRETPGVSPQH